uniref:RING-type domain-containing protein n=1 Tax=Chromera velia CCMP2878 TaxID=1169474 RepID=A0A0G4FVI6_9ALVE|eukprot:Cvel_18999.t1-p1 / transcript=Cvel_18999.t1 / gene=Cvel_18999 / organism=Chromera_velia_CCMP2878 / gene_product=Putative RING-H2 finger protein ATL35, putative / transcript_product=Putative RING-H2 finger protein ATL35, putative / location=Cvel_scaffold1608:6493-9297(-) / protein_length=447 / sequence_SO=supercontig / SO=protein_coding / is_pseudo=false
MRREGGIHPELLVKGDCSVALAHWICVGLIFPQYVVWTAVGVVWLGETSQHSPRCLPGGEFELLSMAIWVTFSGVWAALYVRFLSRVWMMFSVLRRERDGLVAGASGEAAEIVRRWGDEVLVSASSSFRPRGLTVRELANLGGKFCIQAGEGKADTKVGKEEEEEASTTGTTPESCCLSSSCSPSSFSSSSSTSTERKGQAGSASPSSSSSPVAAKVPQGSVDSSWEGEGEGGVLCAVCLEEGADGDVMRRLQPCNHCFHSGCVDRWLLQDAVCPTCKTPVRKSASRNKSSSSSSSTACTSVSPSGCAARPVSRFFGGRGTRREGAAASVSAHGGSRERGCREEQGGGWGVESGESGSERGSSRWSAAGDRGRGGGSEVSLRQRGALADLAFEDESSSSSPRGRGGTRGREERSDSSRSGSCESREPSLQRALKAVIAAAGTCGGPS